MSTKPLVTVIGSTGNQGISVVKTLLVTGKYRIRGLTRNVDSETSKSLISQGVEMVQGNLNNRDDIKRAFQGANIAFAVTNFWDPEIIGGDQTLEVRQGKLIADVAKETEVEWLFWSSLPDTNVGSNGVLKHMAHFNGKYQVEQYIRELNIPATFLYIGFYMTNFDDLLYKVTMPDGSLEFLIPYMTEDTAIPFVYPPKDVGPIVAAILEDREAWRGKVVPVSGEQLTLGEVAKIISESSGVRTTFRTLDAEAAKEYSRYNEVFLESFRWVTEYGCFGQTEARDISVAKKLYPEITTVRQFYEERYGRK